MNPMYGSGSNPRWSHDSNGNWVTSIPGAGTDATNGYVDGCVMTSDGGYGGTGC